MGKEKIMKAILHTKGKTDEQILKDGGMVRVDDVEMIRAYMDAWDGAEVYVRPCFDGNGYVVVGWPAEADAKVKEAFYLMEQDPVFGTYIDDREEFDHVWSKGEYEPDGCVSFDEDDVEIIGEGGIGRGRKDNSQEHRCLEGRDPGGSGIKERREERWQRWY